MSDDKKKPTVEDLIKNLKGEVLGEFLHIELPVDMTSDEMKRLGAEMAERINNEIQKVTHPSRLWREFVREYNINELSKETAGFIETTFWCGMACAFNLVDEVGKIGIPSVRNMMWDSACKHVARRVKDSMGDVSKDH